MMHDLALVFGLVLGAAVARAWRKAGREIPHIPAAVASQFRRASRCTDFAIRVRKARCINRSERRRAETLETGPLCQVSGSSSFVTRGNEATQTERAKLSGF